MKSKDAKLLTALALIMAVALAPVVTSAFAQTDDPNAVGNVEEVDEVETVDVNTDETGTENTDSDESDETDRKEIRDEIRDKIRQVREETKDKIRELRDQRADKVREFKQRMADEYGDRLRPSAELDVRPYDVEPDREPDLYFKGSTSGWAIIGGYAYHAGTELAGEAYHLRGSTWKVHVTDGVITIGDRVVPIEMWGTAHKHRLALHGVAELSDDVQIRIGLRGNYAPTHEDGIFALSLKTLGYHTENGNGRIPLAQVGEVFVEPNVNLPDAVVPEPAPVEVPEIFN